MQSWKVEMIDCPTIFLDSKLLFECFQLWEPPKVSQRVGEQKHFHLDAEIVFIDLFFLKLECNFFFVLWNDLEIKFCFSVKFDFEG